MTTSTANEVEPGFWLSNTTQNTNIWNAFKLLPYTLAFPYLFNVNNVGVQTFLLQWKFIYHHLEFDAANIIIENFKTYRKSCLNFWEIGSFWYALYHKTKVLWIEYTLERSFNCIVFDEIKWAIRYDILQRTEIRKKQRWFKKWLLSTSSSPHRQQQRLQ